MASKKSFTQNNPALAFMSAEVQEEARQEEPKKTQRKPKEPQPDKIEPAPEGYKINPLYIETKSKRLNLLLQPSLVERVKAQAKKSGLSVNETISEAIREYLERVEG